jgi:hypothetical protein
MISVSSFLKRVALSSVWQDALRDKFGIICYSKEPGEVLDPIILRQAFNILNLMPVELVRACGVTRLSFSAAMGPNLPYYPNHGYFYSGDNSITLNNNIFYHPDYPDDFYDVSGYRLSRPEETIYHEFGHALDNAYGDLSLKPAWLELSGWSPTPQKGLKRMVINEPGMPPKIGEWYYKPEPYSGFTRFYGKMNPYDDWADCFAFWIAGMKNKLPDNKKVYFNKLLKKYF